MSNINMDAAREAFEAWWKDQQPSSLHYTSALVGYLARAATSAHTESAAPVDMVLFCPKCGVQHIDGPEWADDPHDIEQGQMRVWENPPHRSHLCHHCGFIWRPADVPTNGVASIKTHGKNDSPAPAPYPVSAESAAPAFDMLSHLARQREFSERTFGPGPRAKGVVDHIRKELREIEADPSDLSEWADVVILALDGFWRAGASPQQIIDTIVAKQTKNEARVWPDWRTMPTDKAIEHDRSHDAPAPSPVSAGRCTEERPCIPCFTGQGPCALAPTPTGQQALSDEQREAAERAIGYVMAMGGPISLVRTLHFMAAGKNDPGPTSSEAPCDHNYVSGQCAKCGCIHNGE